LVDDHDVVSESLRRVLGATHDIDVVGVASTVAAATGLAHETRPDVILMDYRLPDGNGASAARVILDDLPDCKILILSGSEFSEGLVAAVDAGCVGYLEKTVGLDKVVAAVHAAASGEVVLAPDDLRRMASRRSLDAGSSKLTPREREILDLLAEGLTNQAIATRLIVSLNTVRTHVQTVLTKVGAHSKLEAVALATKSGLLARR
jgi:DNA-binding NarL/FixJ family response regulator